MSCKAYTHTGDTLCSYQFFNRIDKRQKSYIVNTHFYYTKEPKAKNNNNLVSETMFKVSQTFFVDYQIKKSTISYIPPRFSEWFTVLSNYQACSINLDVYRDKWVFVCKVSVHSCDCILQVFKWPIGLISKTLTSSAVRYLTYLPSFTFNIVIWPTDTQMDYSDC